jgi:radical SAM protein with 4Fe4S-binding SPASM domain
MPWFCPRAFEDAHITADGSVYLCCSGWVDHPIGQVCCHSLATIWNNEAAQSFRESIHDGSFRHCVSCPYTTRAPVGPVMHRSEVKEPQHREWLEKRTTVVTKLNQLIVAYDRTCNLSCPSCRHEVMAASGRLFKYLQIVQNAVLRDD